MHSHWRTIPGFTRIGSTGKTRGIEGELRLYIDEPYLEDALHASFLFLERNGNKVPLEIESIREVQDLLVRFAGINNPSAASAWISSPVFLPSDEIRSGDGVSPDRDAEWQYHALIGYMISDVQLGDIGEILDVREFPQQAMAVLQDQGRDILIPLNEVFIVRIDNTRRRVEMDLPEGILDI